MTDVMLIDNILTSSDKQDIQFADAQWLYMNDNNNNGYSNYIQFLTTTLKNQFIDYHNAYFWIPMTIYVPASILNFGYSPRPPMICLRESVLSLFANITIATDQGQVIVNDINTMFINNIRLSVEHSLDWMNSEGSLLGFSYDRYQIAPNRYATPLNGTYPWNPTNISEITPGYRAAQGTLGDANNFSPITNDPNSQGQYNLASSSLCTTFSPDASHSVINSIYRNQPPASPVTDTVNILTVGTTANFPVSNYIPLYCPNGNIAYLHVTYVTDATHVVQFLEIGGINLQGGQTTGAVQPGSNTAGTAYSGYGSGLSTMFANGQTGLVSLEATATVAAFPKNFPLSAPSGLNSATTSQTATDVPLAAYGGTCIVPLLCFVTGAGAVTPVQIGGFNLFTGYSNTTLGTIVPSGTTGYISGSLLVGAESQQANQGFKERVTMFQNQSTYQYVNNSFTNGANMHQYSYVAQVPLKLIHDLFMQLDIPIINVGWNLQLFLAQTQGQFASAQFPPFMTSNNVNIQTGGQDDTQNPQIYYGTFKGSGTPCRLYYRVVKFQPQDNTEMAKKLTAGFTKSFTFISTDWIIPQGTPVAPGGTTVQIYLSQSTVHPLRLWALGYPNNKLTGNGLPGQLIQSSSYAPGVVLGLFNNVNIQLNNQPYFRQNMQNTKDLWEQLREQFNPDTGSMIKYEDFANYKRTLCFDLTRVSERLISPTEPVSLIFQATRSDGLSFSLDMFFLIERRNQVTFRFSAADVAIVVGNLD